MQARARLAVDTTAVQEPPPDIHLKHVSWTLYKGLPRSNGQPLTARSQRQSLGLRTCSRARRKSHHMTCSRSTSITVVPDRPSRHATIAESFTVVAGLIATTRRTCLSAHPIFRLCPSSSKSKKRICSSVRWFTDSWPPMSCATDSVPLLNLVKRAPRLCFSNLSRSLGAQNPNPATSAAGRRPAY